MKQFCMVSRTFFIDFVTIRCENSNPIYNLANMQSLVLTSMSRWNQLWNHILFSIYIIKKSYICIILMYNWIWAYLTCLIVKHRHSFAWHTADKIKDKHEEFYICMVNSTFSNDEKIHWKMYCQQNALSKRWNLKLSFELNMKCMM